MSNETASYNSSQFFACICIIEGGKFSSETKNVEYFSCMLFMRITQLKATKLAQQLYCSCYYWEIAEFLVLHGFGFYLQNIYKYDDLQGPSISPFSDWFGSMWLLSGFIKNEILLTFKLTTSAKRAEENDTW